MRLLPKAAMTILLVVLYVLTACLVALLPAGARLRRKLLSQNTSFFSRLMLSRLNIRMHVKHRERLRPEKNGVLIVANHVSYIDVLVLAACAPTVFITSVELGNTFFLGMLARLGGSLFVERRKPSGLKNEIAMIGRALKEGMTVALFPEGTTSNGDRVQKFKNPLFDAAIEAEADVLPICLRYTRVNGEAMTRSSRESVYYYGGAPFFRQVSRLLSLASVDVEVLPLKTIKVRPHHARKELAALAHQAISAAYLS